MGLGANRKPEAGLLHKLQQSDAGRHLRECSLIRSAACWREESSAVAFQPGPVENCVTVSFCMVVTGCRPHRQLRSRRGGLPVFGTGHTHTHTHTRSSMQSGGSRLISAGSRRRSRRARGEEAGRLRGKAVWNNNWRPGSATFPPLFLRPTRRLWLAASADSSQGRRANQVSSGASKGLSWSGQRKRLAGSSINGSQADRGHESGDVPRRLRRAEDVRGRIAGSNWMRALCALTCRLKRRRETGGGIPLSTKWVKRKRMSVTQHR
jgi:hypothetical protein